MSKMSYLTSSLEQLLMECFNDKMLWEKQMFTLNNLALDK